MKLWTYRRETINLELSRTEAESLLAVLPPRPSNPNVGELRTQLAILLSGK